jgi:cytochrome c553
VIPWKGLAAALALLAAVPPADPELGRRIYRQGPADGAQPACASCHRRSGFGTSEGGIYVPRVTGPVLFQPRQLRRADLFRNLYQESQTSLYNARVRDPRLRPAYTPETLAAALREGRDPAGRALDPLMPRYRLSDEEMAGLTAYLQGLSAAPSPGVDGETIHFATVVTEGVDPGRRNAMLGVLEAYVRWKNAETRHSAQRVGFSPWYRDEFQGAYRQWRLHVWELRGPAATWPEQLAAYERAQAVFAVLSGLGAGPWRPVHEFCEKAGIPCLFPNTGLPVADPPGVYALYLSAGLTVEGRALAQYLSDSPERIVQVYRDADEGRAPARALRESLGAGERLVDRAIPPGRALTPVFWKRLVEETRPAVLVLWLGPEDAATLGPAADAFAPVRRIIFSGSLLGEECQSLEPRRGAGIKPGVSTPGNEPPNLSKALKGRRQFGPAPPGVETPGFMPAPLRGCTTTSPGHPLKDKMLLTWPWALPGHEEPLIYRVRAWMRARGIARTHERLQLATWFALAVTDHSLTHIVDNFSRDLFVESVEEETENALNPGLFPSLSLGPGQRFASKGCYVVRLADGAPGGVEAVSGWIVP